MTSKQFTEITNWQDETFGYATALSKLAHLKEEIKELVVETIFNRGSKSKARDMEYADCFILLFGAAASDGMSYQDIGRAIVEKMEINRKRKWGKPNADGVVNHIKDAK